MKVSEMNTFRPSITMVSGTITGRAAASSIRACERVAEAGIQPSVGAVGSSYDKSKGALMLF